jgi:hypothetical protein
MFKFQCLYCGSNQLIFSKWVKDEETVIFHNDNHIEYHQHIDDNDVLGAEHRFICGTCKKPLLYGNLTTEEELINYLNLSDQERAEIQEEYDIKQEQEAQLDEKRSDDEQGTIFTDPEK